MASGNEGARAASRTLPPIDGWVSSDRDATDLLIRAAVRTERWRASGICRQVTAAHAEARHHTRSRAQVCLLRCARDLALRRHLPTSPCVSRLMRQCRFAAPAISVAFISRPICAPLHLDALPSGSIAHCPRWSHIAVRQSTLARRDAGLIGMQSRQTRPYGQQLRGDTRASGIRQRRHRFRRTPRFDADCRGIASVRADCRLRRCG